MQTGLHWSVRVPSGAQLTILPPGTSDGAESPPDCYRIVRHSSRAAGSPVWGYTVAHYMSRRLFPTLGLKKGVFRGKTV